MDEQNTWPGPVCDAFIDRASLADMPCPLCFTILKGNVLWHLSTEHNIECRVGVRLCEYQCCCGGFKTNTLSLFYEHFRARGKDCVMAYLMARKS